MKNKKMKLMIKFKKLKSNKKMTLLMNTIENKLKNIKKYCKNIKVTF